MRWADVLVASWPVDPGVVAGRLPDGLAVDTHNGDAYLSVVPFVMTDVRPRGLPAAVGRTFGELNLRTYVTGRGGRPGIYFFNLDATDPVGVRVARRLFRLPYYDADMRVERGPEGVRFESDRTHEGAPPLSFEATYDGDGDRSPAESGSLSAFLLERYRFFVAGRGDTVYRGEVDHAPWTLADATADFRENDLFAANGFSHPDGDPHLAYSPGVDVTAALPRRH